MSISLTKGGNISLTKAGADSGVNDAEALTQLTIGCGWDVRTTTGTDFDLDVQAVVAREDASTASHFAAVSEKHFVYFANKESPDGAVKLSGDNLTGAGEGDDETISVDLTKLPPDALKIVTVVNIYEGTSRGQSFGQVKNAYVRVLAAATELIKYDLGEDFSTEVTVVVGELYRKDTASEWKFRAVGAGYDTGLAGLARDYGLNV